MPTIFSVASAGRILIEPFVARRIWHSQRLFIAWRSMLANLIGVDEAVATNAIPEDGTAALLFDLSTVFPSVEREMMHKIFVAPG